MSGDDYDYPSIKEYFAKGSYPNKYEWEVMDKANYGCLDDVVREGAERLKDASQRGSGQNRDEVLRQVVADVNKHYHEQNRQYYAEKAAERRANRKSK